jgi:secondary thiamine-phosphate synthase enzyme
MTAYEKFRVEHLLVKTKKEILRRAQYDKRITMQLFQKTISLSANPRGFHLVTDQILQAIPEIKGLKTGMMQVFIQHTSASLTINENADPTVRKDFEMWFNKAVPENDPDYKHDYEGSDDMPAHLKSALLDTAVLIPITNGKLALGTW